MIPVLTVSNRRPTQNYYCYDEFFDSCNKQGINPVILKGEFKGLASKPKMLQAYLESGGVKDKYMIFSDCWDIVFLKTPEEILEKYLQFNSSIVFNAEKALWPRTDLTPFYTDKYPESTSAPYRFLNSGFLIGETESILNLLRSMNLENIVDDYIKDDGVWHHTNDQADFQEAFCNQPVKIELDTKANICQTLHGIPSNEFEFGNTIKNILTDSEPCVFHDNGGGKSDGVLHMVLVWMLKNGLLSKVIHA